MVRGLLGLVVVAVACKVGCVLLLDGGKRPRGSKIRRVLGRGHSV